MPVGCEADAQDAGDVAVDLVALIEHLQLPRAHVNRRILRTAEAMLTGGVTHGPAAV